MQNLRYRGIVALLFFLSSCSFGHYGRLKPIDSDIPLSPIFLENSEALLFKTNIKFYTKRYSGLLLVKQVSSGIYRVIFTTEIGMKLMDFEFTEKEVLLHYVAPGFDQSFFLETIKRDIQTLLMNNVVGKKTDTYMDVSSNHRVDRISANDRDNYYFRDMESNTIVRIDNAKGKRKKVEFFLRNYKNAYPGSITIKHHDFKLSIELTNLKDF